MEAIPLRMRKRIMALYGEGISTKQIAAALGTWPAGTRRIRQRFVERGTLEPPKPAGGYAAGLTGEMAQRLRDQVASKPGSTRQQLQEDSGR